MVGVAFSPNTYISNWVTKTTPTMEAIAASRAMRASTKMVRGRGRLGNSTLRRRIPHNGYASIQPWARMERGNQSHLGTAESDWASIRTVDARGNTAGAMPISTSIHRQGISRKTDRRGAGGGAPVGPGTGRAMGSVESTLSPVMKLISWLPLGRG